MCSQYMGSLKNRKLIFSQVWRFKVLDEGVAGLFSPEASLSGFQLAFPHPWYVLLSYKDTSPIALEPTPVPSF